MRAKLKSLHSPDVDLDRPKFDDPEEVYCLVQAEIAEARLFARIKNDADVKKQLEDYMAQLAKDAEEAAKIDWGDQDDEGNEPPAVA